MANRSKDAGTRAETGVVRYLAYLGLEARRLPLAGNADTGDVEIPSHGTVLQVKAGRYAEKASDRMVLLWLGQAREQAERGGYGRWFLVTKRAGYGYSGGRVGGWWLHVLGSSMVPYRTNLMYLREILGEPCS